MVRDNGASAVDVSVPVTSTTKLKVSAAVGVPEISPVAASRERPGGRLPLSMAQAVAPPPQLEVRVCEYAADSEPSASDDVVTAIPVSMTRVNSFVAVWESESVTSTVNV